MINKVIRNGKVAVLISPEFGAGWSTWGSEEEKMLYDPVIVKWVEGGKKGPIPLDHYTNQPYAGRADDLKIVWVPKGTWFYVQEYDGSESIVYAEDGFVA